MLALFGRRRTTPLPCGSKFRRAVAGRRGGLLLFFFLRIADASVLEAECNTPFAGNPRGDDFEIGILVTRWDPWLNNVLL